MRQNRALYYESLRLQELRLHNKVTSRQGKVEASMLKARMTTGSRSAQLKLLA